ncbi:RNA polymerase sigma factor [Vulgatibacter incomptus]|uniref:RNA polymerase sigma factor n=1 Tax=Vulgatibacter incomptus TaxID=1391653 RepID=A0A0K1PCT4_9BACT|nr:RNA polymerase sigma factor [Vulgatibacter incomptus]AKU90934.1 sigma factor [Vulgatibacter incomptus]
MSPRVLPFVSRSPPPPELSDEALLAACCVGDRGALAVLFQRHHLQVHRFCRRMVGSASDVEDLVQTTFLVAWTDAGRFRGNASVRAWLLGVAANLIRHEHRTKRNERGALERLHWKPRTVAAGVDEQVARRELLERLGGALERLPHELREAFVLCEIEEVPGTEAARILSLRPGTLWRRLHDARKRLLPLISGEEP